MNRLHRSQHGSKLAQTLRSLDVQSVARQAMDIATQSINKRTPDSTSSSSSSTATCHSDAQSDTCAKPTEVSATLPIALGVAIPLTCAILVCIYFRRRYLARQRKEDAADKYKSLDFGLNDFGGQRKKGKGGDKMLPADPEKAARRGRGMSMDIDVGSPYMLPPGLQGSRASLHSLSRSLHDKEGPYRPITYASHDEASSIRYPRPNGDNASTFTGMTGSSGGTDRMNAGLMHNAQDTPKSFPARGDSISPPAKEKPFPQLPEPAHANYSSENSNTGLSLPPVDLPRDSYFDKNAAAIRGSTNYLGNFIHSRDPSMDVAAPESQTRMPEAQPGSDSYGTTNAPNDHSFLAYDPMQSAMDRPPRLQSLDASAQSTPTTSVMSDSSSVHPPRLQSMEASVYNTRATSIMTESDYGDGFKITPPSPRESATQAYPSRGQSMEAPMPTVDEHPHATLDVADLEYDPRRLSMIMRPLPPDDPTENPEERANRIRSFYKEYFDESKPDPAGYYQYGNYIEDYGQEYLNEGPIYDPHSSSFVVAKAPYAQPVTRRAMTPPPRAPPRFQGGPRGRSSSQTSRYMPPPRGQSAMSGRSRKPMPPPTPLTSLPTPHMLKDDSLLFNPIDFAPPTSYRDRQAGRRPDSPLGVQRPYSPVVRAHTPLNSSFDDLSAIPSPHALRKSGTFTSLDFAPPPRFRNAETASDAGSIRSAKSGMSGQHIHAMRAGAYRVSRIPKEVAGTKDDLMKALKPSWDLR